MKISPQFSSLQRGCGEVTQKATEGHPSTTLRAVPLPICDGGKKP